tara:strand:- start:3353 stop:4348 length:996 start_codon:yes stop_codon:yes gene_type:complete
MNQAVEVKAELKTGGQIAAIVPQDAEQAFRMAQMIVQAGMAPKGMNKPEQIVTSILHGLEVGLKPMQAIQAVAVVNGRPTIWGDAALGLVQGSGLLEDFGEKIEGEGDQMVATCRAKRKDNPSPVIRTFTVADAKQAGLWGKQGPWSQYPKRMLQMRARSWVLRDGFADILKGLGVHEEVRDFNTITGSRDITPVTADDIKDQAAPQLAAPEPQETVEQEIDAEPGYSPSDLSESPSETEPTEESKGMLPLDDSAGFVFLDEYGQTMGVDLPAHEFMNMYLARIDEVALDVALDSLGEFNEGEMERVGASAPTVGQAIRNAFTEKREALSE